MISVYGQRIDCGLTIREAEAIRKYIDLMQ